MYDVVLSLAVIDIIAPEWDKSGVMDRILEYALNNVTGFLMLCSESQVFDQARVLSRHAERRA